MKEWIVPLVVAIIAATPGVLAYRQARAAQRSTAESNRLSVEATAETARLSIEAGAYERAKALYESGLTELERQLRSMREQLADERDVSNRLRNQVNQLEDTVTRMRRQMYLHGIDGIDLSTQPPASSS